MTAQKFGLIFNSLPENCVDQMKTHHVFLTDDSRGWHNKENAQTHIMIEAENYQAMRVLEYTHAGKIDMIYADPPYNTGNKDFVYNDAFVDDEDTYRHSKWLSFMKNRLMIARKLLSERGVIFLSIDDHEMAHLKLLCDQVFGENNFVGNFIWETKRGAKGVPPRNLLVFNHEYILCYAKDKLNGGFKFRGDDRSDDDFSNPDNDPRGVWRSESITATGKQNNYFDIINPETGNKHHGNWAFSSATIDKMIAEGKILWPKKPTGKPCQKKFKNTYTNQTKSISTALGWHHTETATKELIELFEGRKIFDHVKPLPLMKYLVQQATQPESIVLDFFAGSGTTGQAVAEVNKEDGGDRQFIIITNNDTSESLPLGIANEATYPRLEKTIKSFTNLRYLKVELLPHTNRKEQSAKISQLEVKDRMLPILSLMHNCHNEVARGKHHVIFTNANKDFFLGVYFNDQEKVLSIQASDLKEVKTQLKELGKHTLLVNKSGSGYASEYFRFMKV